MSSEDRYKVRMSSEDRYKVGMRSEDRWVRMSSEDR